MFATCRTILQEPVAMDTDSTENVQKRAKNTAHIPKIPDIA